MSDDGSVEAVLHWRRSVPIEFRIRYNTIRVVISPPVRIQGPNGHPSNFDERSEDGVDGQICDRKEPSPTLPEA